MSAAGHLRAGILAGKVLFADRPWELSGSRSALQAALGYSGRPRGYRKSGRTERSAGVEAVDRVLAR